RHGHRHTAQDGGSAQQPEYEIGWPSENAFLSAPGFHRGQRLNRLRRMREKYGNQRNNDQALEQSVPQHRLAPADIGDGTLEDRWPQRAREIVAARNQRQRRSASAVEPAADINVERRVDAAEPDHADEQPVPNP